MKIEKKLDVIARNYKPEKDFDKYLIRYGAGYIIKNIRRTNVLEIGCASGIMTDILVRNFKKVAIVEGAQKYAQQMKRKYGSKIKCYISVVERFETKEKFDNIIAAHLIEHLHNPIKQLKRMKKWLKPNGFLHIIVPNANSLNRLFGLKLGIIRNVNELTPRDIKLGHKRVYNKKMLFQHIRRAGLSVAEIKGIYLKPLPNNRMIRYSKKTIHAFYEIGNMVPSDLCNELYARCAVS
ncbi:MAG: class I SAM-dependent methyltransferase [Candidatus Omnitrophota bacterium]